MPLALQLMPGLCLLPGACAERRRALPSPSRLWHAAQLLLCRTSAPILCRVVVSPCIPPPPCPAFLSHPRAAFGALNLPWALLAVLGLAVRCRPSAPPRQRREEMPGPGGGGRALCRGRAPLPLQRSLSCAWQPRWKEPHVCGVPARAGDGGKAVLCPGGSPSRTTSAGYFCASPQTRGEWVAGGGRPAGAVLLFSP